MSNAKPARAASRRAALTELKQAGRENSDATVMFHAAMAARVGLNPTDTKALSILERLGPLTAGDLSGHTGLTAASVTSLIDRLERKRLVKRLSDPQDRRRTRVQSDPAGLAKLYPHFASFEAALDALLASYSLEQLRLVTGFLNATSKILRTETTRLTAARDGTG